MLLVLLAVAGCDRMTPWFDDAPPASPIPAPVVDGPVFTARVTRDPVPPPRWWDDDLPAMPGMLGPSAQAVLDGICYGAPGARQAVEPVIAEGDWGRRLQLCDDPGFCRWALDDLPSARDPATEPRRRGLLVAGAGCPSHRDVFVAEDTPDGAVAAWFAEQARLGKVEDHPRLQRAVARLAAEGDPAVVDALAALAALPDGEARLLALRPAQPWTAREIGLALRLATTTEGREAWTLACASLEWDSAWCVAPEPVELHPLAQLDLAVRRPEIDLEALLARHPRHRTAIRGALERCVRDARAGTAEALDGRRCLSAVAREDWTAARGLAEGLEDAGSDWRTLATSLARYAAPEALVVDMVARGLVPAGTEAPGALTPVDVMVAARRGLPLVSFGDDAQGYLIRAIAAMAGLSDVRIEVKPPLRRDATPEDHHPRYTQLGWVGGVRLRALARDDGYVDVPQAVGFVNALLAEAKAAGRVAVALGEAGSWVAVVGEVEALRGLVDEGLLIPWLPSPGAEEFGT